MHGIKNKVFNVSLVKQFIWLESARLTCIRQVSWVSKWQYLNKYVTHAFLTTTKAIQQTYLVIQFNRPNYAKFERSQNRLLDLKFRYLA